MISVNEYIDILLKKKGWSRRQLCEQINIVEEQAGLRERTMPQNITNYLNGYHQITPRWLVKVEVALGLPYDTLVNMVEQPKTYNGAKVLEEFKEKIRQ
ncbi:MAG: helix-turn-helix transcriptional regulator [Bacilli bacterium]|nr:helix-turn-helix transcriptional regulator [Bacilli bacterium]